MCGLSVKAKRPSDVARAGVGLATGDVHKPKSHQTPDTKSVDPNQDARPSCSHYCVLSNLVVEAAKRKREAA